MEAKKKEIISKLKHKLKKKIKLRYDKEKNLRYIKTTKGSLYIDSQRSNRDIINIIVNNLVKGKARVRKSPLKKKKTKGHSRKTYSKRKVNTGIKQSDLNIATLQALLNHANIKTEPKPPPPSAGAAAAVPVHIHMPAQPVPAPYPYPAPHDPALLPFPSPSPTLPIPTPLPAPAPSPTKPRKWPTVVPTAPIKPVDLVKSPLKKNKDNPVPKKLNNSWVFKRKIENLLRKKDPWEGIEEYEDIPQDQWPKDTATSSSSSSSSQRVHPKQEGQEQQEEKEEEEPFIPQDIKQPEIGQANQPIKQEPSLMVFNPSESHLKNALDALLTQRTLPPFLSMPQIPQPPPLEEVLKEVKQEEVKREEPTEIVPPPQIEPENAEGPESSHSKVEQLLMKARKPRLGNESIVDTLSKYISGSKPLDTSEIQMLQDYIAKNPAKYLSEDKSGALPNPYDLVVPLIDDRSPVTRERLQKKLSKSSMKTIEDKLAQYQLAISFYKLELMKPIPEEKQSKIRTVLGPLIQARNLLLESVDKAEEREISPNATGVITNNTADKYNRFKSIGFGNKHSDSEGGLTDEEIDKMMHNYKRHFLGCYSINEIKTIKPHHDKSFGFCLFLPYSPKSSEGHWVAVYVDRKNKNIEYYNPFGKGPTTTVNKNLKRMLDNLDRDYLYQYKINKVVDQRANSDTCGFHSCKFIIDRINGKHFKEASGYSQVMKSERDVKKMKKKLGKFGYL